MKCQWCNVDLFRRKWYLWDGKPQCDNKIVCFRRAEKK